MTELEDGPEGDELGWTPSLEGGLSLMEGVEEPVPDLTLDELLLEDPSR